MPGEQGYTQRETHPYVMHLNRNPALQIEVRGVEGQLRQVAEQALCMKPNFAYTLKEVQHDVQRVFDSGYFSRCTPRAEDTRDGVKLILEV